MLSFAPRPLYNDRGIRNHLQLRRRHHDYGTRLSFSHFGLKSLTGNIQAPLLVNALKALLGAITDNHPQLSFIIPHPILVASWMGLLITAINLIPAGQLDGGHILYAVFPNQQKLCTRIVVAILIAFGFFFWIGWIVWAGILLMPGMRHPSVPKPSELKAWHLALIPVCAAILLLAFTFAPFSGFGVIQIIRKLPQHL